MIHNSMKFLKYFISVVFYIIWMPPVQAQTDLGVLKAACESEVNDTNTVVACNTLAEEISNINPQSAISFSRKALDISRKIKFKDGITWSHSVIASAFESMGKIDSAIFNYELARNYKVEFSDSQGVGRMDLNIGVVYLNQGYYQPASEAFYRAMIAFEKLDDKALLSKTYHNLGMLYRRTKNYKISLDFYNKSLALKRDLGDVRGQALTLNNMSSVFIHQKDYKSAKRMALESYQFCENNGLLEYGASCLINASQASLRLKEKEECRKQLAQTKELLAQYPDNLDRADYLMAKADLEKNENDLRAAAASTKEAIELYKEHKTLEQLKDGCFYLAGIYSEMGKADLAIEWLNKAVEINDTIYHRENIRQVNEMQIVYKTKSKEKENEHLRMENRLEQMRAETSQNQRNILLASIFVFVLLGIWILRLLWQKNKAYDELDRNKKALEVAVEQKDTLLRELHHRVKNNLQVVTGLLDLQMARIKDADVIKALNDGKNRIRSMALIHQKLYRTEDLKSVDMQEYLEKLLNEIRSGFAIPGKTIETHISAQGIQLDIDVAIPLGLVVNELVTNSFKYAFEEKTSGMIDVSIEKNGDRFFLKIKDDGPGYDFVNKASKATLGLRLVNMLVKQIRGTVEIHNFSGTEVEIQF
jgi:two-component sensor histidine kinase